MPDPRDEPIPIGFAAAMAGPLSEKVDELHDVIDRAEAELASLTGEDFAHLERAARIAEQPHAGELSQVAHACRRFAVFVNSARRILAEAIPPDEEGGEDG